MERVAEKEERQCADRKGSSPHAMAAVDYPGTKSTSKIIKWPTEVRTELLGFLKT